MQKLLFFSAKFVSFFFNNKLKIYPKKQVGGIEEYYICDAIKSKRITKPLIAWCIGTCASMFTTEVQFGHAGSHADNDRETAVAKNKALKAVGAYVPNSFDELGDLIQ